MNLSIRQNSIVDKFCDLSEKSAIFVCLHDANSVEKAIDGAEVQLLRVCTIVVVNHFLIICDEVGHFNCIQCDNHSNHKPLKRCKFVLAPENSENYGCAYKKHYHALDYPLNCRHSSHSHVEIKDG